MKNYVYIYPLPFPPHTIILTAFAICHLAFAIGWHGGRAPRPASCSSRPPGAPMQVVHAGVALALLAAAADGAPTARNHGAQHAQHGTVLAEPLAAQPDTSNYYSQQAYTDTFAPTGSEGFYDPYASNFLTQEQDRTDAGLLGGLTIGVLITVFLAALLGSIVAPALTAAVTRCQRIYSSGTLNINWYISIR